MNRCIQCYRCVRYYRDFAGGRDLNAFCPITSSISVAMRAAPWRASSAATSRRSARPASSRTRRSGGTTPGSGTCRPPPPSAFTARSAATRFRESATRSCAGSGTAITARSTGISCATGGGSATSSSTARCASRCLSSGGGRMRPVIPADSFRQTIGCIPKGPGLIGIGSPRASVEANFALRTLVGAIIFTAGYLPGIRADPPR